MSKKVPISDIYKMKIIWQMSILQKCGHRRRRRRSRKEPRPPLWRPALTSSSSNTPVTQPQSALEISAQTSRWEKKWKSPFFCPVPSHQNQEAILGEYQRGNWNYEFEANFLRPDFYTVVSQIRKSEMGLLRFLFYVAAINEFPAEYLSIIFFETIFRGERTQTWGIILKFK